MAAVLVRIAVQVWKRLDFGVSSIALLGYRLDRFECFGLQVVVFVAVRVARK